MPVPAMRLSSSMLTAQQTAACRLAAPRCSTCTTRQSALVVRAQQTNGPAAAPAPPVAAAAAAEQQQYAVSLPLAVADTAAGEPQQQVFDEMAVMESGATYSANVAAVQQQAASVRQAVPPPTEPRGMPLAQYLKHPGVRMAGIAASVFLGGTLLLTLFRMGRDPQRKRSKTINKNKMVVDALAKYLPGRREALNATSLRLLKLQTGFSSVEVFRKYLWFLLRERQFDEEALGDLVALKATLGLSDEEVANALRERAERVYEKYGTVMVNLEGMSQSGLERKAAARNLFMKLLSLIEARSLLTPEAAATVDLCKVFGVTQRDVLMLSSGYSAEAEGSALEKGEGEGGEE